MKSSYLTSALVAASMAFVSASQAGATRRFYELQTPQGDLAIKTDSVQTIFQSAADLIAEKIKDNTLPISWKLDDAIDIGIIKDSKGTRLGTCHAISYASEVDAHGKAIGYTQKIHCWDGQKGDSAAFAQTQISYEKN